MSEFWEKGIITSNKEQKKKYPQISPIAKEKDDDECDNNNFRICRSYSVECSFLPRNFVPTIKPKQSIKQINPLQLTKGIIHETNNLSEDESENKRKKREKFYEKFYEKCVGKIGSIPITRVRRNNSGKIFSHQDSIIKDLKENKKSSFLLHNNKKTTILMKLNKKRTLTTPSKIGI